MLEVLPNSLHINPSFTINKVKPADNFSTTIQEEKSHHDIKSDYNQLFTHAIPDLANLFSIVGNAFSGLMHLVGAVDTAKNIGDSFATFGTKLFLSVNSFINTVENFGRNNYLAALGYCLDNPIAFLIPEDFIFLARGLSSGTYHLAHFLSVINNNRTSFKSFEDHFEHLQEAFTKFFKTISSRDLVSKFFDSEKAIPGVIGGFMNISAPLLYPFIGKKISSTIRDIGAVLKASCHLSLGHLRKGRKLFFASGVLQILAALSDFLIYLRPNLKGMMVPLSLGLDGYAKYVLRQSVNKNELGES